MMTTLRFRLTALVVAIAGVALLLGLGAQTTWRQVEQLREKLSIGPIGSFQAADEFRASLVELDFALLRFEIHRDATNREQFLTDWRKLNRWIDETKPTLTSENEKLVFNQIDAAYDFYLAAATNLLAQGPATNGAATFANFEAIESNSQRLTKLVYQLDRAHQRSLDHFVAESHNSLANLRALVFGALALLLLLGTGLAIFVYRDLIAPLKIKLLESHALLERHEKLASLGMLAAGVAHEIHNPLTAIKARLFTQRKLLAEGTPAREDAEVISGEISRLERIVKDFLHFARPSEPEFAPVQVDELLKGIRHLLQPALDKARVQIVVEPSAEPIQMVADAAQIKQVLINLVRNAADAVGSQGTVTLRARLDTKRLGDRSTEVVVIKVEDTGPGISPEVEKRLFDPFFTTKESGTGLGLPIAARIVEKHNGALQYQTRAGGGTTFGLVVPRMPHN